jgi:hypothetical protein
MNAQEIRDLFKRHSLPLSRDDVWEVRPGSPVVKHAPLERLATVIGVEWGPPQILRAERAKDRVILKLAGLHGAYSEEEADDFKQGSKPEEQKILSSKDIYISKAIGRMGEMESAPQLLEWAKSERKMVWPQYGIEPHDEDGRRLVAAYKERMAVLGQVGETEAAA